MLLWYVSVQRKCHEMSVLGISLLSSDQHTVVNLKITDIRDMPFIILYAHYAIYKVKGVWCRKKRGDRN